MVHHPYHVLGYLKCALDNFYLCGTPIRVTLGIMERIRLSIPQMKRIWEYSAISQRGRDKALQTVLWAEEDIRAGVESGKYTLDSKLMPEPPK